jgi:hypothetical protein
MEFDPGDASRAVMAALLQTLWGVSPPYVIPLLHPIIVLGRYDVYGGMIDK